MAGEGREEGKNKLKAGECWFCEHPFIARSVRRDGIIRSRGEKEGGPYHLYICPACGRENVCERTGRGRWFASPNYRFTLLDYVFAQVLDHEGESAQTVLAAISWFRDNEDRRRYFFERDGDSRYSRGGFLRRLWPWAPPEPSHRTSSPPRASSREAPREDFRPETPRPAPRIVTPYEVLGLAPGATEHDVRTAFHRLAIHYHPDKVRHLGEEFERVANEKFLRLKEAYEALVGRRMGREGAAEERRDGD